MANVNYDYFVEYVGSLSNSKRLRILDYGCGAGAIVGSLRRAGFNALGCDVFYEGGRAHGGAPDQEFERLLSSGYIVAIEETGQLPWPEETFDLIIANMVFEHVQDFDTTISRMARVLAPEGRMVLHFPTAEVWREGHIGIPFAHWFKPGSSWRRRYTLLLRRLGLGYFLTAQRTPEEWTDAKLDWLDKYTIYRPYPVVRAALDPEWLVEHNELQYIRFRAQRAPRVMQWVLTRQTLAPVLVPLFRRLGFNAFVLKRRPITALSASR
jgi:SAM-dependent methyltransferase